MNTADIPYEIISQYNKHEIFIPTEFAHLDYERSWKKCHCGRVVNMKDNYCGSCGQKLGKPDYND